MKLGESEQQVTETKPKIIPPKNRANDWMYLLFSAWMDVCRRNHSLEKDLKEKQAT